MLRNEMMQCYNTIKDYNIALYSSTAVVLTFALQRQEYFLCMIPMIIIVPLHLLSQNRKKSICYIASYLYFFLEGNEYNWERRHEKYDLIFRKKSIWWIDPHYFLVITCGLCSIYKLLNRYSNEIKLQNGKIEYIKAFSILIICLIILVILRKTVIDYNSKRAEYIKQWRYMLMHHMIK